MQQQDGSTLPIFLPALRHLGKGPESCDSALTTQVTSALSTSCRGTRMLDVVGASCTTQSREQGPQSVDCSFVKSSLT